MKTIEEIFKILDGINYISSCSYDNENGMILFCIEASCDKREWFEIYIGYHDDWSVIRNYIENFIDDYDVDYETYKWLGPDGHGKNGAPYHIQSLLDHYVEIKEYLEDILMTLNYKMEEV